MSYYTKEEYLGAIFKLRVLAGSKAPISSPKHERFSYRLFKLGICSADLLPENKKFRTREQFCPLDLDKATKDRAYGCFHRCAYFEHKYSVEQIYKLIEDFEVKD